MSVRVRELFQRHELAIVALLCLAFLVIGLWSYQLIDPWETHYGEVARRILQDHDWIHLRWQDEIFRSKPALTPWLIAAGMGAFGVATNGGTSGELVGSDLVELAVRLPFALFGALGLVMTWWMLARLVNRRVAWLAVAITATSPLYCMVARQAITDIPLVAALMGAVACFAMAVHAGDEPLRPIFRRGRLRIDAHGVFFAVLGAFTLWQAVYDAIYFHASPKLAPGLRVWQPGLLLAGGMVLLLAGLAAWSSLSRRPHTRGRVWMYWFYLFVGVSVLGKGPPGIGLAGAICLFYLILTGRWRLLARVEIPRGVLITALVAVPWHLAMFFKDGRAWVKEYFFIHMLDRVSQPEFGNSGNFDYYASVLGSGMWPWVALLPAALAAVIAGRRSGRPGQAQVRLLVGIWAVVGTALFAFSSTKYHHYILPVVPALAILVAFWLDDVLEGRGGRVLLAGLVGAALAALAAWDLVGEPEKLIELFIYRYDRPWPGGDPWNVDVSGPIIAAGLAAAAALVVFALPWRRARAAGLVGLLATGLGFSCWAANDYMIAAAPHWGQRELHRTYYRLRAIHGVEIEYWSLRDLADRWGGGDDADLEVDSLLPDGFRRGLPMTVRVIVPGAGVPGDEVALRGQVSSVGDDRFSIAVPRAERARLAALVARGRKQARGRARPPWMQVDADRLIAWQLNWRGENFWSSGEIYGETDDTRTVFARTAIDNKPFLAYLKEPRRQGQTFFLITEAGRVTSLKGLLPTKRARDTLETIDRSCNKFTLVRFVL
ncbi:MAG TPA: glycosyltransferase family 39 protein [Kofleriaceae bacterium]|nr:glycosyltransferase family 39 protein [Kofleriaceae bacterium]